MLSIKNGIFLSWFTWCVFISLPYAEVLGQHASQFLVQPYLQDAEPTSIKILWETSSGEESMVEWGATPALNNEAWGFATDINFSESRLHEVQISGLERLTTYYYRVRTGDLVSDIFQFKTPPFAGDRHSFRLVAMSDMQKDQRNPSKFREVVQEGIIPYFSRLGPNQLPEQLALVLIPGDLVVEGPVYEQWRTDFFAPAQPLFSEVPVYPVPGNHERNADFFFKYFALPQNGSPAYAEHWWYKDYGNLRIIGMDSNKGYDELPIQLDWLDTLLEKTEKDTAIDFVFAQMHHPHKSELWLAGESDFTGKVVKKLERFSTETGKPSIHFFGHTHGYSRGQSRDHRHVWVNVATAGGRIDQWGQYAQKNYDEFTVTQAEYGFVVVEVESDQGDPSFTLRRISLGKELARKNNVLTDSITVFRSMKKPEQPVIKHLPRAALSHQDVHLRANPFLSSMENAYHAASHWQVSEFKDFSEAIKDSWKQHEDWYFDRDLQQGDDLAHEHFIDLQPAKHYYWRVRYRDQFLNWSDWSDSGSFTTKK